MHFLRDSFIGEYFMGDTLSSTLNAPTITPYSENMNWINHPSMTQSMGQTSE
jgi:hypothetical protein